MFLHSYGNIPIFPSWENSSPSNPSPPILKFSAHLQYVNVWFPNPYLLSHVSANKIAEDKKKKNFSRVHFSSFFRRPCPVLNRSGQVMYNPAWAYVRVKRAICGWNHSFGHFDMRRGDRRYSEPLWWEIAVICNWRVANGVMYCTRSLPIYVLCPCPAQHCRWNFFRIGEGNIKSDKVFRWLHLNFCFITTVFLFVESG